MLRGGDRHSSQKHGIRPFGLSLITSSYAIYGETGVPGHLSSGKVASTYLLWPSRAIAHSIEKSPIMTAETFVKAPLKPEDPFWSLSFRPVQDVQMVKCFGHNFFNEGKTKFVYSQNFLLSSFRNFLKSFCLWNNCFALFFLFICDNFHKIKNPFFVPNMELYFGAKLPGKI